MTVLSWKKVLVTLYALFVARSVVAVNDEEGPLVSGAYEVFVVALYGERRCSISSRPLTARMIFALRHFSKRSTGFWMIRANL
jgi:hypothetical protein